MRIFITGATTGIGLELSRLYLQEGHTLGVCGRDRAKFDSSYKDMVTKYPGKLFFYPVDVTDREKLAQAVSEFAQNGLDMMIANAGISMAQKSRVPDFSRAKKVLETNILGVLYSFEVAMKFMLSQKHGQLVAISSVAGFAGLPGTAAYSASKAAVTTFCESLAIDLRPLGICVTTICPGFIDTPLTRQNKHFMPFLMPAPKAAKKMKRAIERKKELYIFPLPMKFIISFLHYLPRNLYRALLRTLNLELTGEKVL